MLRKIKEKGKISPRVLQKMAKESFKNSTDQFDAAKLLYDKKCYGPAYSLICLAIEEFSKFLILQMCTIKMVPEEIKHEFIGKTLNHKDKIELFKALLAFMQTFYKLQIGLMELIARSEKEHWDGARIKKEKNMLIQSFTKYMEGLADPNSDAYKQNRKIIAILDRLDDKKQLGFYVDVDDMGQSVLTPKEITKSDVEELMEIYVTQMQELVEIGERADKVPIGLWKRLQKENTKRLIDQYVATFGIRKQ